MATRFRIVSGTRVSRAEFEPKTALGQSLAKLRIFPNTIPDIYFENARGLPDIYNEFIGKAAGSSEVLAFVHDDVHLVDPWWMTEAEKALRMFDIVGIVGNRRRAPNQPGWAFPDMNMMWDKPENLSGAIGHGDPPGQFSAYGPFHQSCKLLDGVMLVCKSETLQRSKLLFDPQFDFHFYDLDFCRQAELRGLTMGTAAIKAIHQSVGAFGASPAWHAARHRYFAKYGS